MNTPLKQPAGSRRLAPPWTAEEIARGAEIYRREAIELHGVDTKLPRGERQRVIGMIAMALRRSVDNVGSRLSNYGPTFATHPSMHRALRDKQPPRQREPRAERWSETEIEIAASTWASDVTNIYGDDELPRGLKERVIHNIAAKLGRLSFSVEARLRLQGPTFGTAEAKRPAAPHKVSTKQLLEREARDAARRTQSLTATLFGDPPPGFSALDRRRR